ncbi:hypothetical protein VP01_1789g3 [Puccinia sorghi]|uniref:Uncharacterized protein n=1 Tax=Puccinia sorghi TaxID=27349 RepID=A0A0L6VF28_9BASI|nr:hypothetical protein VP01_1789g3 [Puccinia sorghi]
MILEVGAVRARAGGGGRALFKGKRQLRLHKAEMSDTKGAHGGGHVTRRERERMERGGVPFQQDRNPSPWLSFLIPSKIGCTVYYSSGCSDHGPCHRRTTPRLVHPSLTHMNPSNFEEATSLLNAAQAPKEVKLSRPGRGSSLTQASPVFGTRDHQGHAGLDPHLALNSLFKIPSWFLATTPAAHASCERFLYVFTGCFCLSRIYICYHIHRSLAWIRLPSLLTYIQGSASCKKRPQWLHGDWSVPRRDCRFLGGPFDAAHALCRRPRDPGSLERDCHETLRSGFTRRAVATSQGGACGSSPDFGVSVSHLLVVKPLYPHFSHRLHETISPNGPIEAPGFSAFAGLRNAAAIRPRARNENTTYPNTQAPLLIDTTAFLYILLTG